jgi:hypothetical protein
MCSAFINRTITHLATKTMIECVVVTCYYRFSGSKHPDVAYDAWMYNMLSTIETMMVIFCEDAMKEQIVNMRGNKPTLIVIRPLLTAKSADYLDYWQRDNKRDKEHYLHTPLHYVVWNEKVNFVRIATKLIDARTYCWCDIGCFRSRECLQSLTRWPVGNSLSSIDPERIYVTCVKRFQQTDLSKDPVTGMTRSFEGDCRLSGAIMIGHKKMWKQFYKAYYAMLHEYMKNDMFAGVDQNILASLFVIDPTMFQLVEPQHGHGDPWFYLQQFFC